MLGIYDPVRIFVTGDDVAARALVPEALKFLRRLREQANLGDISLIAKRRVLAGGECRVVLAGGYANLYITATTSPSESKVILTTIPDFYSGVVQDGFWEMVTPAEGTTPEVDNLILFHPTTECVVEEGLLSLELQETHHLGVKLLSSLYDHPINPETQTNSQYANLKATMYSGQMRQLVQLLLGFGRQLGTKAAPQSALPKIILVPPPPLPESQMPFLSQYEKDVYDNGLQIKYDYSFNKTHGIGVAADGKRWIVELSRDNGVVMMPLALNPNTTLPQYRGVLAGGGFHDPVTVIDAYGGFPTGEPIPTDLDPWIRAGRVIQPLTDLDGFYASSGLPDTRGPFSTAIGWAFNYAGNEARNCILTTDTSSDFANVVCNSIHGQVTWSIDASDAVVPKPVVAGLKVVFALHRDGFDADVIDAAIWKLDRLTADQLSAMPSDPTDAINYVDGLVLTPLTTATASYTEIERGLVSNYGVHTSNWSGSNAFGPMYVPFGNIFIVPASLAPVQFSTESDPPATLVNFDTTAFVYFSPDDVLHTVNVAYNSDFDISAASRLFYVHGSDFDDPCDRTYHTGGIPNELVVVDYFVVPFFEREGFIYAQEVSTFNTDPVNPVSTVSRIKAFGSLVSRQPGLNPDGSLTLLVESWPGVPFTQRNLVGNRYDSSFRLEFGFFWELTGNVFGSSNSMRVSKAPQFQVIPPNTYAPVSEDTLIINLGTLAFGDIDWPEVSEDISFWFSGTAFSPPNFFYTATYIGVINAE